MKTKATFSVKNEFNKDQILGLYFLFHNPIAFRDRYLPNMLHLPYKTRYYQYAPALCDDLIWGGARTIGKSLDMNITIIQKAILVSNAESLVSAYRRTHIKDRLEDVISYMMADDLLRRFFKGNADKSLKDSVSRTPIYTIKLRNNHVITGISVGDDPNCVAIQGHHPQIRYIEETQTYPKPAWLKFQNTQAPEGSVDRFYGVPDGRIDTPFRELDTKVKKFNNKRFHISRRFDPNFNKEKKEQYIQTLGGENSNEFLAQVDAKWGEPTWGVWNEGDIMSNFEKNANDEYPKRIRKIEISAKDYKGMIPSQVLNDLLPLPENDLEVILAIDPGYSQPTVILPFYYFKGKWCLDSVIKLIDRMIPDDQAEIIDYIASYYRASFIPMDCSSAEGKAPASSLSNPKRDEFSGKNYDKRIIWVEFQKSEIVGYKQSQEGDEDSPLIEIKEKLKAFTTNELRTKFANKFFRLAYDESIPEEFNSESQKRRSNGIFIDTPADVHIPEAFRCFAYGWWLTYGKIERPDVIEEGMDEYSFILPSHQQTDFAIFGRGEKNKEVIH